MKKNKILVFLVFVLQIVFSVFWKQDWMMFGSLILSGCILVFLWTKDFSAKNKEENVKKISRSILMVSIILFFIGISYLDQTEKSTEIGFGFEESNSKNLEGAFFGVLLVAIAFPGAMGAIWSYRRYKQESQE